MRTGRPLHDGAENTEPTLHFTGDPILAKPDDDNRSLRWTAMRRGDLINSIEFVSFVQQVLLSKCYLSFLV